MKYILNDNFIPHKVKRFKLYNEPQLDLSFEDEVYAMAKVEMRRDFIYKGVTYNMAERGYHFNLMKCVRCLVGLCILIIELSYLNGW